MSEINRIREVRKRLGWTLEALAAEADISTGYLSRIESGKRGADLEIVSKLAAALGVSPREMIGTQENTSVRLMGFIGAGAEILPEFEQVSSEGLDTIELPFPVPDGLVAFQIRGDSMMPRYDPDDVLLVYEEQRRPTESLLGEDVAVKIEDGRRFLKRLMRGPKRETYNLESWNARTIEAVRLEWIGEVYLTLRAGQLRRIEQKERLAASRRAKTRAAATSGMSELPIDMPKTAAPKL